MREILEAINDYKDLAIQCALQVDEKTNILLVEEKAALYQKIINLIGTFALDIKVETLHEAINLITREQAND
jgi:hypothetical protein